MVKHVIHISEKDAAATNVETLLKHVRSGAEIVIQDGEKPVAVLHPAKIYPTGFQILSLRPPDTRLAQERLYLEEEIRGEMDFEQIVGNSPALKQVLQLVETVAASDSTVLLLGETGTGKEPIARAIHERSRRNQRTFVKLNCAAIPKLTTDG
jgi:transcriptional regulator with AAA-type ATPase domain